MVPLVAAHVSDGNNAGGGSKPTCEEQHNHDDQDDTEDADATASEAVTVTAKAATESAEQKYDKDDNEDGSERIVYLLLPTEQTW
jgi:hypothetical protein